MSLHLDYRRSPITGHVQVWCNDRQGWYVILHDDELHRAICRGCLADITERLAEHTLVELPKLAA